MFPFFGVASVAMSKLKACLWLGFKKLQIEKPVFYVDIITAQWFSQNLWVLLCNNYLQVCHYEQNTATRSSDTWGKKKPPCPHRGVRDLQLKYEFFVHHFDIFVFKRQGSRLSLALYKLMLLTQPAATRSSDAWGTKEFTILKCTIDDWQSFCL